MTITSSPLATKPDTISTNGKEYALALPSSKPGQRLGISIDRTGWVDPTQQIKVSLLTSLDGGVTWMQWCSFEDRGGTVLGPKGVPIITAGFIGTPPPAKALIKVVASAKGTAVKQALNFVEAA